jgi:uncharacterized protein (TIGR02678 family)
MVEPRFASNDIVAGFSARSSASGSDLQAERQRAFRTLLRNPLLSAAGETADDYILVRRHSEWLKDWLTKFPSWSLHVDKHVARMRKSPPDLPDQTRPAVDRTSGTAFTKRRYALLCLTLAALEQFHQQTTLAEIARAIAELVSADRDLQAAGLIFDTANYDQRRDLIYAVRLLVQTGVLDRVDGDESQFLNRRESSDVLYDIRRPVLTALLNVSRSPSALEAAGQSSASDPVTERAAKLIDDPVPLNENARFHFIRSRLVRTLLEDPVLYFDDLNDEERLYLEEHRAYLLRQISEATGMIAEARREGIAMVDDLGDLTDIQLPEQGTIGHLSLLLVQWFAECAKARDGVPIAVSAIHEHVRELIQVHGLEWRKQLREPGAERQLTDDALRCIRALRLIRWTADGVVPMPACGRYAASERFRA